jgi:hypothetical protein
MSANLFPLFELWGDNPPMDPPLVLAYEFKTDIETYLGSLGENAPVKTLEELIAFNAANAEEAIPNGQDLFELSLELGDQLDSPEYLRQLNEGKRLMGTEGFQAVLEANNLDALVFTEAWSSLGAIPGYPSISVPAGYDERGHPIPIEFLAGPYSEGELIEMAYAYEQGTMRRRPPTSAPMIAGDYVGFGDFDGDGLLGAADLDMLIAAVRSGENSEGFDVTGDSQVDSADLREYVTSRQRLNSFFGDSNLDGRFNRLDLVHVLIAGQYEDGVGGNSTWATGDWNGDGEFDSGDLLFAMQEGGYEGASRTVVNTVPEPSALASTLAACVSVTICLLCQRRRRSSWS